MKCSASYILKARITQLGRGRVLLAPDKPKTSSWLASCPKGFLPVPGAACCPCGSVTSFLLPSSCSISFFLRGVGEEGKGIGFRAPPFQTAWFYLTGISFWAPHFQTARFYLPKIRKRWSANNASDISGLHFHKARVQSMNKHPRPGAFLMSHSGQLHQDAAEPKNKARVFGFHATILK